MTATLKSSPSVEMISPATYTDAPYGVRGVDFVRSSGPRYVMTLKIEIDGDPDAAAVERAAQAALDAFK